MRHNVAIALIICGTLLALAPPASDYFRARQASQLLLERADLTHISFNVGTMSKEYRFGCWALGAVMIGVGIYGGWRREAAADDPYLDGGD